jgi:hypothetical protein
MTRCPRCPRCQGTIFYADDACVTCLYCGETIRDEPTTGERLESNSKPEWAGPDDERIAYGPRLAIEAPSAVTARVLAAIREANGG